MHISQIDSVDLFSPFFIYLVQWTSIIFKFWVKTFSLDIHVKTLMTHEASLRRSFRTNRCCEVPNFPGCRGPRVRNFFETPCTYTIVERCGNFIYPVGDSR